MGFIPRMQSCLQFANKSMYFIIIAFLKNMIFSIDAEIAFDKIQYPFMIKFSLT